ncbi:isochorismatase family protein [Candidatus Saccharibacteria bacterium]|nr:MAG: isochorismatase family protein [Candidatus Saccharibacteria bacterium]
MNAVNKLPRTYSEVIAINVDIQNDFALPSGALSVNGGEDIVNPANSTNKFVRENSGQVIFTQDWHRPDNKKHFEKWPVHCVQHKAGAALHDNLDVVADDTIAQKGMYLEDDGYSGWGAELQTGALFHALSHLHRSERTVGRAIGILARQAAEKGDRIAVLIQGLATDYCDRATVVDALNNTSQEIVDVYVVTDAMKAVNIHPEDGARALAEMLAAGAHPITSQEIVDGSIVIDRGRLER